MFRPGGAGHTINNRFIDNLLATLDFPVFPLYADASTRAQHIYRTVSRLKPCHPKKSTSPAFFARSYRVQSKYPIHIGWLGRRSSTGQVIGSSDKLFDKRVRPISLKTGAPASRQPCAAFSPLLWCPDRAKIRTEPPLTSSAMLRPRFPFPLLPLILWRERAHGDNVGLTYYTL